MENWRCISRRRILTRKSNTIIRGTIIPTIIRLNLLSLPRYSLFDVDELPAGEVEREIKHGAG
jgi:hypothetical protein